MATRTNPPNLRALLQRVLDTAYRAEAAAVLRAIMRNSTGGTMARRLAQLVEEADRLAQRGDRLDPSNPYVRALGADFEEAMRVNAALVDGAAPMMQQLGIGAAAALSLQLALPGFTPETLASMGVRWQVPDPDVIARVAQYANSAAWAHKLERYGQGVARMVADIAVRGVSQSWGPLRTARAMQQAVQTLPASYANQLMRTLQLTTYRDADVAHRLANANILAYQIRIATLDDRTCMACVAQHGEELPLDARIDDHWSGRCTSITVLKGRPAPVIERGEAWFSRQPSARQEAMMGGGAYDAWQAGALQLGDLVHEHHDDLFGRMITEASLVGALGPAAQQYYRR